MEKIDTNELRLRSKREFLSNDDVDLICDAYDAQSAEIELLQKTKQSLVEIINQNDKDHEYQAAEIELLQKEVYRMARLLSEHGLSEDPEGL